MGYTSSKNAARRQSISVTIIITIAVLWIMYPRLVSNATDNRVDDTPQSPRQKKIRRVDYTKFSHNTAQHRRECNACHKFPSSNWKDVRKEDEAFPDVTEYPQHSSCIECHRQQFFARERPAPRICSNCHVNVTPRNTERFPFPSLGEKFEASKKGSDFVSEFNVYFPHDKHLDLIGQARPALRRDETVRFVTASFKKQESEPKSCAVCHKIYQPQGDSNDEYVMPPPKKLGESFWLKKGTFETLLNSHTVCFTCHSQGSDFKPDSSDCNACHKLAPTVSDAKTDFDSNLIAAMKIKDTTMLKRWRTRDSSGTFRHEGGAHPLLSCTACHNIAAMNTLDQKTLKVPIRSCGGEGMGCHIEADKSGILKLEIEKKKTNPNFQCAKCHLSFSKRYIPESHLAAIQGAKTE